ncbi:MAG: putative amidohydrolase YtcJ [Moritella dasanensis]|jgi:predicted amidohydrolase YtcJ
MTTHTHEQGCTHCGCNDPFGKDLLNAIFVDVDVAIQTQNISSYPQNSHDNPLIISGGTIRPVTQGNADITVEAIGVLGKEIIAIGTFAYVKTYFEGRFGKHTFDYKYIEKDQTLLPGLIEPHVHTSADALITNFISLSGIKDQMLMGEYNLDYINKALKAGIDKKITSGVIPKDIIKSTWVLGKDIDPSFMPFPEQLIGETKKLTTLDLTTLNDLHNTSPLALLSASAHTLYINTEASKQIWEFWNKYSEMNDNESSGKNNSDIKKWLNETRPQVYSTIKSDLAKGKTTFTVDLNGQLQEMKQILWAICAIPDEQLAKYLDTDAIISSLEKLLQTAPSKGITLLYDASFNKKQQTYLRAMKNRPPVRIGGALECSDLKTVKAAETKEKATEYQYAYMGNMKLVSDGSNQGLTGYQYHSYDCYPAMPEGAGNQQKIAYTEQSKGVSNFSMPQHGDNPHNGKPYYPELVKTAVNNEWPLMIHANGDHAINDTIEVYKKAYDRYIGNVSDWVNMRHRIEHCSLLNLTRIEDMRRYAISPSFLIGHVGYWGYAFDTVIFKEQAQSLDLCQSSIAAGLKITLHSDFPVSPVGPLRLMEQAITRVTEASPNIKIYTNKFRNNKSTEPLDSATLDDNTLNISERLSGSQAVSAATYNAAWQCHADAWVGSLEVGKFADFVILKIDPVTMTDPFLKMREFDNVLETWIDGKQVYSNEYIEIEINVDAKLEIKDLESIM